MERLSHVYDCNNKLIFFDHSIYDDKKNLLQLTIEQYARVIKTMSAPAIIIELHNNSEARYYFRVFSDDKSLLAGVIFCNGVWKLKEYLDNPSGAFLLMLLKKNLLAGSIKTVERNEVADKNVG